KSDGTAAGTVLVKDIVPGSLDSTPTWLTAVGDTMYFVARDTAFQTLLWKTDGTAAGTVVVKPSASPSGALRDPEQLIAVGSRLVFSATDQAGGRELW